MYSVVGSGTVFHPRYGLVTAFANMKDDKPLARTKARLEPFLNLVRFADDLTFTKIHNDDTMLKGGSLCTIRLMPMRTSSVHFTNAAYLHMRFNKLAWNLVTPHIHRFFFSFVVDAAYLHRLDLLPVPGPTQYGGLVYEQLPPHTRTMTAMLASSDQKHLREWLFQVLYTLAAMQHDAASFRHNNLHTSSVHCVPQEPTKTMRYYLSPDHVFTFDAVDYIVKITDFRHAVMKSPFVQSKPKPNTKVKIYNHQPPGMKMNRSSDVITFVKAIARTVDRKNIDEDLVVFIDHVRVIETQAELPYLFPYTLLSTHPIFDRYRGVQHRVAQEEYYIDERLGDHIRYETRRHNEQAIADNMNLFRDEDLDWSLMPDFSMADAIPNN